MYSKLKNISFIEAINIALHQSMRKDKKIVSFGLGINDPKRIFNSTKGLVEKFGDKRVFDIPTSENALMGVAIGLAMSGIKPIYMHQRLDFFLLAMDQLINGASKWHYMFGGKVNLPITIRLIIGRGWGQGPTHSQNLHSWFAHVPGLKVIMPSNPYDAKGLLIKSIFDPNPVIFLEHRWLHNSLGKVPNNFYSLDIGKAKVINKGKDLTIIASSYMVADAINFIENFKKINSKISIELIDVRTIKPLDKNCILKSVNKTKRVMVLDPGFNFCGFASEIISMISINLNKNLKYKPVKITVPDIPEPTSRFLVKYYYPSTNILYKSICKMFNLKIDKKINFDKNRPVDVPGEWFKGPF
jgi:pyruvate dehydrogenase E1 component beta subunit